MNSQAPADTDKVKEILEKFECSSLSLQNAILEINSQLSNLKVTHPIEPLSSNYQTSNI